MKEAAAAASPPAAGGKGKESISNRELSQLIVVKQVCLRALRCTSGGNSAHHEAASVLYAQRGTC